MAPKFSQWALPILQLILVFQCSSIDARRINITNLDNCRHLVDERAVVYATKVDYHVSEEDGLCDQVHMRLKIETVDPADLHLMMTLYKCEEATPAEFCSSNPTFHEEYLDCTRLIEDDTGPWHMFTSAMDPDYTCGKKSGEIEMTFMRFKLEHLMKYLDIYDSSYSHFRLKMYFKSTGTNALRACGDLDFSLLA